MGHFPVGLMSYEDVVAQGLALAKWAMNWIEPREHWIPGILIILGIGVWKGTISWRRRG